MGLPPIVKHLNPPGLYRLLIVTGVRGDGGVATQRHCRRRQLDCSPQTAFQIKWLISKSIFM